MLFSKEAGILLTWVSSSRRVFNALDRWLVFIGFASDEASLRLPRPFIPYINSTSPSFSSISILLIFERETVAHFSSSLLLSAYPSLSLKPSRGPLY